MIEIESLDQLVDTGIKMILEEIPREEVAIPGQVVIQIKIKGADWDEYVDYRAAQFVLDLQKAVNQIYFEAHGASTPLRGLNKLVRVKIKVDKGSSVLSVNLGDALKQMVGNMTGGETLIFTGICAATVASLYTIKKVMEYKERVRAASVAANKDTAVIEKLTSTIDHALEVIESRDLQAPARRMVNRLADDDAIVFPDGQEMSASDARQRYPRKPKTTRRHGIFDATYTIKNIDLSESPPDFTLIYKGFEFKAAAEMPPGDIEGFAKKLEETLKAKVALEVPFHIFILYNDRRIISASIQGTGTPRANSDDISNLISSL